MTLEQYLETPLHVTTPEGLDAWRAKPMNVKKAYYRNWHKSQCKAKLAEARKQRSSRYFKKRWEETKSDPTYHEAAKELARINYSQRAKCKTALP